MQATYPQHPADRIRRMSITVPLTLAAAVAALLIAGAVLVMMNSAPPDDSESVFGAVSLQETATAFRSTEEALLATVDAAMTQFADVQAQLEAAQLHAVEQTAQEQVWPAPTATPFGSVLGFAETGVCPSERRLNVYAEPDLSALPLTEITADMKYAVQGTLLLNDSSGEWLLVIFDAGDGKTLRGWVLAAQLHEACAPTIVPFTAPEECLPLLLHNSPSRDAELIAEVPLSHVVQVEGSLTLNTGQTWLVITAETDGPLVRGWTSADLIPAACLSVIAPQGLINKMDAAPIVEQMADGRYQITLSIAEEPEADIKPGDEVYVLAELSYAPDRRAWTVVAQGVEVVDLSEHAEDSPAAWGGFVWMDAVLASDDEETVTLLQEMASVGVAFSLERND